MLNNINPTLANGQPSLTNPNRAKPWNITQLAYELSKDLQLCQNNFERSNCRGVYTKEIRELRDTIAASGRKFTPGEIAVMDNLQINY